MRWNLEGWGFVCMFTSSNTKKMEKLTSAQRESRQEFWNVYLRNTSNRVICLAPHMVIINGINVGGVREFKKACKEFGFVQTDFSNWPFTFSL